MKGTWEFFVLSSQLLSQNKKLKKKKRKPVWSVGYGQPTALQLPGELKSEQGEASKLGEIYFP